MRIAGSQSNCCTWWPYVMNIAPKTAYCGEESCFVWRTCTLRHNDGVSWRTLRHFLQTQAKRGSESHTGSKCRKMRTIISLGNRFSGRSYNSWSFTGAGEVSVTPSDTASHRKQVAMTPRHMHCFLVNGVVMISVCISTRLHRIPG